MEEKNDIDLERELGGTVYTWDEQDRFYRDVITLIKRGTPKIYIYNKNIYKKIQEEYPCLKIVRKEFYWEVINDDARYYSRKKGRPRKKQNNNT